MLAQLRSPARIKHWRAFPGGCHQKKVLFRTLADWLAWHRSQTPVLHLRYEQVTHRHSPRLHDRGPIEASTSTYPCSPQSLLSAVT